MTKINNLAIAAKQLQVSCWYIAFNIAQIVFTMLLIGYVLYDIKNQEGWVVLGELVISLCLIVDVCVSMAADFSENKRSVWFYMDLVLLTAYFSILGAIFAKDISEDDDVISLVLLILRYLIQMLRLGLQIFKTKKKYKMMKSVEAIEIEEPEMETLTQPETLPEDLGIMI